MAELAGLVVGVTSIFSSAVFALERINAIPESDQNGVNLTTLKLQMLLLEHNAAANTLQYLLTTDIKNRLSQADLARIDILCKSSLVLSSTIFAEIKKADWKRKPNTSLAGSLIKYTADLTRHIKDECKRLEDTLQDYAFDGVLRESLAYSRADAGGAEANDPHQEISMEEQQPSSTTSIQSESSEEHIATPSSSGSAEVLSITTSFAADVDGLSKDRHADKVKKEVHLTDDHDECQMLSALLDTGANCNCISEAKFASLRLGTATRRLSPPTKIRAADGEITVTLVVKGRWRFPRKARVYTHLFYVVPNLAHDVVICRDVIFDYGLLMDNPELCSLGLPDEFKNLPELYVMSMKKLSKDEAKKQDERTKAKEKANKAQRDQEAKEAREAAQKRLAPLASSSNASSNAGNPASSSGSSNTSK